MFSMPHRLLDMPVLSEMKAVSKISVQSHKYIVLAGKGLSSGSGIFVYIHIHMCGRLHK